MKFGFIKKGFRFVGKTNNRVGLFDWIWVDNLKWVRE
jgi:hypothetical protein